MSPGHRPIASRRCFVRGPPSRSMTSMLSRGIFAEHASGLTLFGHGSLLHAAVCYWDDYDLEFACHLAEHARQKVAFDYAYDAVRAVGVEVLGPADRAGP
jgi:hypothetical protein